VSCVEQSAIDTDRRRTILKTPNLSRTTPKLPYFEENKSVCSTSCNILKKNNRFVWTSYHILKKNNRSVRLPVIFWRNADTLDTTQNAFATNGLHIAKVGIYMNMLNAMLTMSTTKVPVINTKWHERRVMDFFFSCDGEISKLIWLLKYCHGKNDS
jgi:hypothetical protein